jgi:hypothetical protein
MEMLIIIGYVAFATLSVFSLVNMLRQINKIKDDWITGLGIVCGCVSVYDI